MKKRIWSLLSFLLIAAMLLSSYTVAGAEKTKEEKTQVIRNIFYAVETGGQIYGNCRYDDVTAAYTSSANETAITIGAGQWMGNEAKILLKLIQSTDPDLFSQLDTAGIAEDLELSSWKYYDIEPDSDKGKCIAAIISSDVGKKCQDQQMDEQIQIYLDAAEAAGITDMGGQVMYAETMHCGGKSAANRILGHTEEPYNAENYYKALTTTWPEDSGFNAPISGPEGSMYYNRHTKVYGWVKEYLLGETEDGDSSDDSAGDSGESSGGSAGNGSDTSGDSAEGSNDSSASGGESVPEKQIHWILASDGNWFLYDGDGKILTGWQYVNGSWYYLDTNSGAMKIGWQFINGNWYYLSSNLNDGAMKIGWQFINGNWYYLSSSLNDGAMKIGRQFIDGNWYYLSSSLSDGAMKTGWWFIDSVWYYFYDDGRMATDTYIGDYYVDENGIWIENFAGSGSDTSDDSTGGGNDSSASDDESVPEKQTHWMQSSDGNWYLNDSDGKILTGWQYVNGNWYYLDAYSGTMKIGWQFISGKWYYLSNSLNDGSMKFHWQYIDGNWYYFGDPGDGAMKTGWQTISGQKYYLAGDGSMKYGWQYLDGNWYYFGDSGDGAMKTGWQTISGQIYYLSESDGTMKYGRQKIDDSWYYFGNANDGAMKTGWWFIDSIWYYYYSDGRMATDTYIDDYYVDENGAWVEDPAPEISFTEISGGQRTIKNLLQNAMKPVGSTLYIWGGGHDTGNGGDGKRYGVNPQWKAFYDSQDANYDYTKYRYSYGNGLDCSGFVGWAVYNTVYTQSDQSWSTTTSYYMAGVLAEKNYAGTGKTGGTLLENPTEFCPGDVVSMNGHTYIVIGQCSDGSLVLVHAAPPAVQISGTITPDGNWDSEARQLAQAYMETYYPDWYFTPQGCGLTYLTGSASYPLKVNRWTTDGTGIFTDPEMYQTMSAKEVLADLFEE